MEVVTHVLALHVVRERLTQSYVHATLFFSLNNLLAQELPLGAAAAAGATVLVEEARLTCVFDTYASMFCTSVDVFLFS